MYLSTHICNWGIHNVIVKCKIYLKRRKKQNKIMPKQELKILHKNNGEPGKSLSGNIEWLYRGTKLYNCMYIHQLFYFTEFRPGL